MLPKTRIQAGRHGEQYMLMNNRDYITERITSTGGFEMDLLPTTFSILDKAESGRVLDIGANLGAWSIPTALRYPQHDYIAFEPQRVIYYQLCGNIVLNSLDYVYAHNVALGQEPDVLELAMPDYGIEPNVGGFTLDPEIKKLDGATTEGQTDMVEVVTLDSLEITDIRLIKLDVEGLELEVLKGAEKTLKSNDYPPIIFEAWTQYAWYAEKKGELWDYLQSLGYEITDVCYNNFLAQHKL